MFNKENMDSLKEIVQQALTLHNQEQASGGVEDEKKWAQLTEQAEQQMNAIDEQLQETEEHLDILIQALDVAIEIGDTEKIGTVMNGMFRIFE